MRSKDGFKARGRCEPSVQSLAMLAGGGALAVFGAARRSWPGAALAAAGGLLAYRGVRASGVAEQMVPRWRGWSGVQVQCTMTINLPADELFRFWRDFENLPRFMRHLQSVSATGERRTRWVAKGPLGMPLAWEADFVEDAPRSISWCSVEGSQVETSGFVQFSPTAEGRGAEVRVSLEYKPVGGRLGAAFATLFGKEPRQTVREDLRRFKQLAETGEIAMTDGQSSGRRSKVVKMAERLRERQEAAARTRKQPAGTRSPVEQTPAAERL